MKLIECVPNFSEGRDRAVIDAITAEISGTPGAVLLDVDPGAATNRTVVTFIGPPEAVEEAAFRAIRKAAALIDMQRHTGEHARIGATDVCPFVPVSGATMDDCVAVSRSLGARVGSQLGIPVYLYEAAATRDDRRSLADIRKGEYEGLEARLEDPSFAPDFGPRAFNAGAGATVIGARPFLIAYNVNLNTRDKKLANTVAQEIREAGKPKRGTDGKILKDAAGKSIMAPGRFKHCRAVGWYIEEFGRAQVSINLTDYRVTPLHEVFEACREEAARLGLRVTGSELVGLIPREALLAAGDHFLTKQGKTTGVPEAERVHAAVLSLGLAELGPFDARQKVIEYRYAGPPKGLVARTVRAFTDELSSDSPAPGGGSVAALCGALSAALSAMVAALTWSKAGMEGARPAMKDAGDRAQALKDWFLDAVDRDTDAFNAVLAAIRLPKKTPQEIARRAEAVERANQEAMKVPLDVLEACARALELALVVARDGNPSSVSDAGVGAACALAAAEGASLNVRINAPSVSDAAVRDGFLDRQTTALDRARALAVTVRDAVESVLDQSSAGTRPATASKAGSR
ncbi:MAG TPA: glutamate formimidoyltransferase [Candidatus Polarisedimenticolaceae bacterium]|nr:glutamate formimidoyltransferase [Candidatus Polarisedimenticolaceae bacterium]